MTKDTDSREIIFAVIIFIGVLKKNFLIFMGLKAAALTCEIITFEYFLF